MSAAWEGGSVSSWLVAFLLTAAIELPIATLLLARAEPYVPRRALLVLFAQLVSHPAVWFVFPALGLGWGIATALSEAWAFVIEAAFYRLVLPTLTLRRALVVSALANGASFGVGLALQTLF